MAKVAEKLREHMNIQLINTRIEAHAKLNDKCGAEFVHKESALPSEVGPSTASKCASFDGDADRLIYFKKSA